MKNTLRAYLDLVRIPNVFTAVADVIAGFIYAGGRADDWPDLLLLAGATSCLYGGGVALNDLCDVHRDAHERPDRPIPSGRISRRAALRLVLVLLAAGIALAAAVSNRAAVIALVLVMSIVLYDSIFKATMLAPAIMGLCRALNFLMAMSLAPSLEKAGVLVPLALVWLYVTSLTFFARHEAGISTRARLAVGTIGLCSAVGGLVSLCWIVENVHTEYVGAAAVLGLALGYLGLSAAFRPQPASVERAVKTFVMSIIGFDACIAWSARGVVAAVIVALTIIPTVVLSSARRGFRVT